jgi:hypothetical protein
MKRILLSSLLVSLSCTSTMLVNPVLAQGGPVPGGNTYANPGSSAPSPGAPSPGAPSPGGSAAPVPGPSAQQVLSGGGSAAYRRLPLNHHNAAIRLEELRNIMLTAKPKEFQDAITDYLDWLGDMADAHWKIYQSFSKVESLKPQADVEKQSTLKLGSLKRQAMLLKAEFLIRNNRQPEALQPLVDIVVAEPRTATGEAAYSLLKQIGFSDELPLSPSASGPSGSAGTAKPIALGTPKSLKLPSLPETKQPSFSIVPSKTPIAGKATVQQ